MTFPSPPAPAGRNPMTRWVADRRTPGASSGRGRGPETAYPAFAVALHERGEVAVVEVTGELDIYTAPALREALLDLTATGRTRIVVDLLGVAFLDSTALGVLVGGYKRVRAAGGYLRLACPAGPLAGVFRTTGLDGVLPLYASVPDAVTGTARVR
jgi:anti-sigma B factor antagonist